VADDGGVLEEILFGFDPAGVTRQWVSGKVPKPPTLGTDTGTSSRFPGHTELEWEGVVRDLSILTAGPGSAWQHDQGVLLGPIEARQLTIRESALADSLLFVDFVLGNQRSFDLVFEDLSMGRQTLFGNPPGPPGDALIVEWRLAPSDDGLLVEEYEIAHESPFGSP